MKIHLIPSIIAIAICSLIAYGFYSFGLDENKLLLCIGGFAFVFITLIFTIGVSTELPRTNTNIKTLSGVFFLIALTSNLIFTFVTFIVPLYIIVNGILLLAFVFIIYSIYRAKQ